MEFNSGFKGLTQSQTPTLSLQTRTSPCTRHEDMWEKKFLAPLFPILALKKGDWSALRPGRFAADERVAVPVLYKAGWAQNMSELLKKSLTLS